jgi:hypothetical protein
MTRHGHMTARKPGVASIQPARRWLQRTCDCGNHTGATACADCRKKKVRGLQRQTDHGVACVEVPPVVYDVLDTAGRPLDPDTRNAMGSCFGHDFSDVRVHDDAKAAESARAVNARAYTVGSHIVFGTGRHRPANREDRSLLAHELTHVVQQSAMRSYSGPLTIDPSPAAEREAAQNATHGDGPVGFPVINSLQRTCLPTSECHTPAGQSASTRATVTRAAQVQRRQRREQLCNRQPPDPACTSDGHGAAATNIERLLREYRPDRLALVHGIFVDRDIPSEWRAYRKQCDTFVPPVDGSDNCIFVQRASEQDAGRYHGGSTTIDGMSREDWRLLNLRVLMHETGHARFEAVSHPTPSPGGCTFDNVRSELHEIAADMDECEAADDILRGMNLTPRQRRDRLQDLLKSRFIDRAKKNWKEIQCVCECNDAIAHLRHTASTMTLHWPLVLESTYHTAMIRNVPNWPFAAPQPLGPGDFPEPASNMRMG